MIIRCPSCSSRFDFAASRFDADGTMIKCSVCGHGWLEGRAIEIARETTSQLPAVIDNSYEPDLEIRRLVDATRNAQEAFAAKRKRRRSAALAWCGFGVALLSPVVVAAALPETIVRLAPASIAAYQWLGQDVNIYGLDIRKVEVQHLLVDGTRVVAIKGEIANVSSGQRKIPWLRFGLKNANDSEVYDWLLDTATRPLNPGESTNFVTRVASPPESAGQVEIRFASAAEISAKDTP